MKTVIIPNDDTVDLCHLEIHLTDYLIFLKKNNKIVAHIFKDIENDNWIVLYDSRWEYSSDTYNSLLDVYSDLVKNHPEYSIIYEKAEDCA